MAVNLKGRDFLKLEDFTKEELKQILDTADYLKMQSKMGVLEKPLKDKTLAMIFEKSSTRTRISFEVGIQQLGGNGLFLSKNDIHLGKSETVEDTSKVLARFVDGIMIRTFGQDLVETMAENSRVPVINALTDKFHPCQIMADFQTLREKFGKLQGLKLAYIGDCANVANSLLIGSAIMGIDCSIACPKEYQVEEEILNTALEKSKISGAKITITEDIKEAVKDADAVYTDIWISMGKEEESKKRLEIFKDYKVTKEIMNIAKKDAVFMHCLPAHRGEEVTSDVIDGPWSIVFDEAENRLHAQKAIMALIMG